MNEHLCSRAVDFARVEEKVNRLEKETERTRDWKGEVMKEIEELRGHISTEINEVSKGVNKGLLRISLLLVGIFGTGLAAFIIAQVANARP